MATNGRPYAAFLADLRAGVHHFGVDTDKVALLRSTYTPGVDTHATLADVNADEVVGDGYTAGGLPLTNVAFGYDPVTRLDTVTSDPVTWTSATVTFRYAVLYRAGADPASSRLIGVIDFETDRVYNAEPLRLSFPSGAVQLQAITEPSS